MVSPSQTAVIPDTGGHTPGNQAPVYARSTVIKRLSTPDRREADTCRIRQAVCAGAATTLYMIRGAYCSAATSASQRPTGRGQRRSSEPSRIWTPSEQPLGTTRCLRGPRCGQLPVDFAGAGGCAGPQAAGLWSGRTGCQRGVCVAGGQTMGLGEDGEDVVPGRGGGGLFGGLPVRGLVDGGAGAGDVVVGEPTQDRMAAFGPVLELGLAAGVGLDEPVVTVAPAGARD